MKSLLTDTADELARQLHVVRRRRVFSGSSLVQTLVFGWLNQPDATGDQRAQMAARCQAPVTEQALDRRFTPELAELLRRLIETGVGLLLVARPRSAVLLGRFSVVVVQDSGGRNGLTAAAAKVQVQFDLVGGGLPGLQLEPGKQPDQATTLAGGAWPAGTLQLADLGYFDLDRLAALDRAGMFFLSRNQVGTAVFDVAGKRLDLWKWLAKSKGTIVDIPIWLGVAARLRCRLVAVRCPSDVVRKRRQRLRREARKKGRPISAAQWDACAWTVLVTNVLAEWLTAEEALIVYGARWQVETTFQEVRSCLHLETTQGWCRKTVLRVTPCLFGVYSVVAVLYNELPPARRIVAIPWPGKSGVTFSDALTAVRRWIWSDGVFSQVRGGPAIAKLPGPVRELLYAALAPAA